MEGPLKRLRIEMGLTQAELSEKTQVNLRTIQNLENKPTNRKTKQLITLANFFDVQPSELLSRNNATKKSGKKLYDENGDEVSIEKIAEYIKENIDLFRKDETFHSQMVVESLRFIIRAQDGNGGVDLDKIK